MKGRLWLEGAGVGILLTLGLTWNQLSSTHLDLYHRVLPVTTVVQAITVDLVLVCLLSAGFVWLLERIDPAGRTLLWGLLVATLAARAVDGLIAEFVISRQGVTPLHTFVLIFSVFLLLWIFSRSAYSKVIRGMRLVLLLLGFCIFWMVPYLTILGMSHQPQEAASFRHAVASQPKPHRRIVWLLFDEMSWDQAFVHRWQGLSMPNFDRLRGKSISFSSLQPDGYYTDQVIPSLFLNQPIVENRSTPDGQMLYRSRQNGPWIRFNGEATLFADAKHQGWTTGIVGEYNPYCRLLAQQLDSCWEQLNIFSHHLSQEKSTFGNLIAPLYAVWARQFGIVYEPAQPFDRRVEQKMDKAFELLADEDIDFAMVHLILPHPPGNYDRKTGRILEAGSYIDNLAFADQILGKELQTLSKTSSAGMTTLVVSSDHSWRVPLWRHSFAWTEEDERASRGGNFDSRPVLMVSFPAESAAQEIGKPVPLSGMHDMFEQMISGQINSPEQLDAWIANQESSASRSASLNASSIQGR